MKTGANEMTKSDQRNREILDAIKVALATSDARTISKFRLSVFRNSGERIEHILDVSVNKIAMNWRGYGGAFLYSVNEKGAHRQIGSWYF